jgi:hypothetical protein
MTGTSAKKCLQFFFAFYTTTQIALKTNAITAQNLNRNYSRHEILVFSPAAASRWRVALRRVHFAGGRIGEQPRILYDVRERESAGRKNPNRG